MTFEWDAAKNIRNIQKHGIDFNDAKAIFSYPMLTAIDRRKDYAEERWIGIGIMKGVLVVAAYTESDDEVIRFIMVRKATRNEAKKFKEKIGN